MVFEKVKAILAEQFDVEEDTITYDTKIADDLGADSLDVVDLLMSIEDEFEIEDNSYMVLYEDENDDDAFLFKVDEDEDGNLVVMEVVDEDEFNRVNEFYYDE